MTKSLGFFDFTAVNFEVASLSVPLGSFDFDSETSFFVGLEIFNAECAEVQLHVVDCDRSREDLADDDTFVAALENHISDILRCEVKLVLNEVVEDTISFDML
jgi:hypothetical protein